MDEYNKDTRMVCEDEKLTKKASMQEAMALRRDLPPRPLPPPPPRGRRFPGKLLLRPYKPRKKHVSVKSCLWQWHLKYKNKMSRKKSHSINKLVHGDLTCLTRERPGDPLRFFSLKGSKGSESSVSVSRLSACERPAGTRPSSMPC